VRYCLAVQNFWTAAQSVLWNVAGNWSLGHVPTSTEQAVFTGIQFNNAVEVNGSTKIDSIVMQNGYNALITIDDGVVLETTNGFNLSGGTANIDFKSTTSTLQADAGNSQLGNFEFTDKEGNVNLNGGTLVVGNSAASDSFCDFRIHGTLLVNNTATANFQGSADITIWSDGQMTLLNTQIMSLWSALGTGGIINNFGSFSYTGAAGANPTEIHMAFRNNGSATFNGGRLRISNKSASTSNVSAMMKSGSFTLKGGINLTLDQGYLQTGGLFSVADATPATLTVTANSVELDGGKVQLGTTTTFGTLNVVGGDVNFNGAEFDAKILGSQSFTQDKITTDHKMNLGNSSLVVTAVGNVGTFETWEILNAQLGITGNFATLSLPSGVTARVSGTLYWLTS
jgi:hypothetical protein